MAKFLESDEELHEVLLRIHRVVVLGASRKAARAGYYVPAYLQSKGYDLIGIRPAPEPEPWMGQQPVTSLDAAGVPLDILLVFRRSEAMSGYLDEIVAVSPSVVWFQEGSFHDAVAASLLEHDIDVVGPRCILAEHRRLIGDRSD